jgi:hypothetical protein
LSSIESIFVHFLNIGVADMDVVEQIAMIYCWLREGPPKLNIKVIHDAALLLWSLTGWFQKIPRGIDNVIQIMSFLCEDFSAIMFMLVSFLATYQLIQIFDRLDMGLTSVKIL